MIKLTGISLVETGVRATYNVSHANSRTVLDEELIVQTNDSGKVHASMRLDCDCNEDFDGTIEKLAERFERIAIALRAPRKAIASIPFFGDPP